jgi:hypothetical protein
MQQFFEQTLIACCAVLCVFLLLEANAVVSGYPYDIPSYAMYYDLFLKHGLFEKTGIGIPDLSWIEFYPVGSLLFFYPVHLFLGDVLPSAVWTHILVGILSLASITLLIYKKRESDLHFFQCLIIFLMFCHFYNFISGRTSELEVIFFASLFFLTERKEKVFVMPLMFFTNPAAAFPYFFLFAYVSFKERNQLFIAASLISLLSIAPFLYSFFYPNISSILARYTEGTFNPVFLFPPLLALLFMRKTMIFPLSILFLILVLLSNPFGLFGINILGTLPILRNVFLCTWSAFFGFFLVMFMPQDSRALLLLIIISLPVALALGGYYIQHGYVDDLFKGLDRSKTVFMYAYEDKGDVIGINPSITSFAYLRNYDIDITPYYWFADKRYISEFSDNFAGKTCGDVSFLKARGFKELVLFDDTSREGYVKGYLDTCNLSYRMMGMNGSSHDIYVIDIPSFRPG